ncbi:hypothetical protein UFOVP1290_207 [uncultured Caudovirales phage]|uniref:Uncharacterized protein n=1 Tax=uncultured Caudovirales phage TaxID=2100421 RepID=A0A6J5RQY0_9CAUD|nr:hypothetical protein UFOVP1290_207 [uncultured Caudovirales phage]
MITHVAIKFRDILYSLPKPNRHHHIISDIVEKTGVEYVSFEESIQGFLDDEDNFLNRKQALRHALLNNQVLDKSKVFAGELTSENLW